MGLAIKRDQLMMNLIGSSINELTVRVKRDDYFMNEFNNKAYFLALVDEEFIYDAEQLAFLIAWIDEQKTASDIPSRFSNDNSHFKPWGIGEQK